MVIGIRDATTMVADCGSVAKHFPIKSMQHLLMTNVCDESHAHLDSLIGYIGDNQPMKYVKLKVHDLYLYNHD